MSKLRRRRAWPGASEWIRFPGPEASVGGAGTTSMIAMPVGEGPPNWMHGGIGAAAAAAAL